MERTGLRSHDLPGGCRFCRTARASSLAVLHTTTRTLSTTHLCVTLQRGCDDDYWVPLHRHENGSVCCAPAGAVGSDPTWPSTVLRLLMLTVVIMMILLPQRHSLFVRSQLVVTGSVPTPHGSTDMNGMEYDPVNHTLYLVNFDRHTIVSVWSADTVPLAPTTGSPWGISTLAGQDGVSGRTNMTMELDPTQVTFFYPADLVGWPTLAVAASSTDSSSGSSWVGLWITDYGNHAVRFIHFGRGNNVTTVAGGGAGSGGGFRNGVGFNATLNNPAGICWAGFYTWGNTSRRSSSGGGATTSSIAPFEWRSFVFWSDESNHCVRAGIPTTITTVITLQTLHHMVLNVSSFVGLCGGPEGAGEGRAFDVSVLNNPLGIAVVNPFPNFTTTTTTMTSTALTLSMMVMFVGEYGNKRLSMVFPLFPESSRMLSVLWSSNVGSEGVMGVTIGRVSPAAYSSIIPPTGGSAMSTLFVTVHVEVFLGLWSARFFNVTVPLQCNISLPVGVTDATTGYYDNASAVGIAGPISGSTFASMTMSLSRFVAFVPYPAAQGTLVVFSGKTGTPLQHYCCLKGYSTPIDVTSGGWRGAGSSSLRSHSMSTATSSATRSEKPGCTLTRRSSRRITRRRGGRRKSSASITFSVLHKKTHRRGVKVLSTASVSYTWHPAVRRKNASTGGPEGSQSSAAASSAVISAQATQNALVLSSSTVAVVATSAVTSPVAASKAMVASRVSAVWECVVVGPSQVVANDPQQFLSFGIPIGDNDDQDGGGGGAVARGALIITSGIRLCMVLGMILLLCLKASSSSFSASSVISVIVAVSIGYFTPNVLGLCTSVLLSSSSTSSTIVCAVISALVEASMVSLMLAAVCPLGAASILRVLAKEFIDPIRRRRRWYYRIAGIEDVLTATLVAVCSNIPLTNARTCTTIGWTLLALSVLHLGYVALLRPYRTKLDTGLSIGLALVNAIFALICCVVSKNGGGGGGGPSVVSAAVQVVTASFYVAMAVSVGVTVWNACRRGPPTSKGEL